MTQRLVEELKGIALDQQQGITACFGTVVSQDNNQRMLKVMLEPFGIESGWLRVLQVPYVPIPHSPHDHNPPPATTDTENQTLSHKLNSFSSYNWMGKEVVVLMLYDDINSGVVLGPLW